MSENQRAGGPEINSDLDFQEREWRFQHIGGLTLLALMIAGLLGIFGGDGPLSTGEASSEGRQLRVEFDRFEQFMDWTLMRVYPQQSDFTLWIERGFAEMMNIDHLIPAAESESSDANRLIYEFSGFQPGEPITFYFRFSRFGLLTGEMGIEGGDSLRFTQIVYP